jgi:4,5-DOPA dioxygenase extradiol
MSAVDRVEDKPSMPCLFIGHGNPMNAIDATPWSDAWTALAQRLPRARAILCISAHWYVDGTFVTGNPSPKTIHDFGGFPRALYEVAYPAPGDPELAKHLAVALAPFGAALRMDWGLDHGAWSVMTRLCPSADVPVLQLSIHSGLAASRYFELGRALEPYREQGVLILGSGNITHNLGHALRHGGPATPEWAASFDFEVARALEQRDTAYLTRALESDLGRMAHPTPEHYWPLLYAMGASRASDAVSFPITGFDFGSLSMRSVMWA